MILPHLPQKMELASKVTFSVFTYWMKSVNVIINVLIVLKFQFWKKSKQIAIINFNSHSLHMASAKLVGRCWFEACYVIFILNFTYSWPNESLWCQQMETEVLNKTYLIKFQLMFKRTGGYKFRLSCQKIQKSLQLFTVKWNIRARA